VVTPAVTAAASITDRAGGRAGGSSPASCSEAHWALCPRSA
jgi:hypothetical protein